MDDKNRLIELLCSFGYTESFINYQGMIPDKKYVSFKDSEANFILLGQGSGDGYVCAFYFTQDGEFIGHGVID